MNSIWKRTTVFFLLSCGCLCRTSLGFSNHRPLALLVRQSSPAISQAKQQTRLFAKEEKRAKGVYARPSAAVERGSGFFVPGLEGPKVRLLFGLVLLGLTGVNHLLAAASASLWSLEETIAIIYSVLVLFQAAIEFGKEELIVEGNSSSSKTTNNNISNKGAAADLVQQWSTPNKVSQDYKSRVQWSAASYLAVTPATQMLLLQKDSILYRLGGDDNAAVKDTTSAVAGIQAALDQLRQSKGGRIALPLTHPAVVALCNSRDDNDDTTTRTVVLQRVADDSCWMMTSDQLLASFTKADLKWLGQLASYTSL